MSLIRASFLFIICVAVVAAASIDVWPQPQTFSATLTGQVSLDPKSFQFSCQGADGSSCPQDSVVVTAFQRYHDYIFFAEKSEKKFNYPAATSTLNKVFVVVKHFSTPNDLGVDERYILKNVGDAIYINATTEWGGLRGLETFYQLTDWTPENGYTLTYNEVNIDDKPRFPWRGLLVDSSRHFLPVKTILRQIDALAFNKMNVMHWHITDDSSFPIMSKTYPLLSQKGAWVPSAVYSTEDVQHIIEYARQRGVRVMPEFDLPAHATSWAKGYPFLGISCSESEYALFDPTNEDVYTFLQNFLTEMAGLFPDQYLHLGGDEVNYICWEKSAKVNQYMKNNNIPTYEALQNQFEIRIQKIASQLGKTVVFWEESFDKNFTLLPSTAITVWLDTEVLINVVKSGQVGIQNAGYYLDQQTPGTNHHYFFEDTWQDFYLNEPFGNLTLPADEAKLVQGGEGSMWSEQVDDGVIDARIWPRASATAERLWSPRYVNNVNAAFPRLIRQRCLMERRGVHASPIRPDWCWTPENIA